MITHSSFYLYCHSGNVQLTIIFGFQNFLFCLNWNKYKWHNNWHGPLLEHPVLLSKLLSLCLWREPPNKCCFEIFSKGFWLVVIVGRPVTFDRDPFFCFWVDIFEYYYSPYFKAHTQDTQCKCWQRHPKMSLDLPLWRFFKRTFWFRWRNLGCLCHHLHWVSWMCALKYGK